MFTLFNNRPNKNSTSYIMSHYDLYDKFTTDRAAGAVNGTSAEPIGGPRTGVDTNSKISIAGGVLDFATGAAVNDGVWWTSLSRLLGRPLIVKVVPSDTNGIINVGFDTNTSGAINDRLVFAAAGVLQIVPNGGTAIAVGTYTATTYHVCGIMRTTGFWWYIKGGAFTYWTPLYITALGTAAGIPAINVGSATTIFTADDIRASKRLFIPVPLQSDGFSASTTDGAGTPEANGPVGSVWTGATWAVGSGVVKNTPSVGAELLTDGGLENWNSPTDLTSWTETLAGTSTINQESTTIHGGTFSARLDIDASNAVAQISQQIVNYAGDWISTSYWMKTSAAGKSAAMYMGIGVAVGAIRDPGTTWNQYFDVFRATAANMSFGPRRYSSASASIYVDDISIKPLTLSTLFRSLSHSSANVIVDADLTIVSGTQAGVVVNLDDATTPANFVIAYHDGTNFRMDKCVAGVYTNLITNAATYSAGATIRVIKDGTTYRGFYANVAQGSAITIADAGIVSNTLHGLFSTYDNNSIDNYRCLARGNEGQWEGLNSL